MEVLRNRNEYDKYSSYCTKYRMFLENKSKNIVLASGVKVIYEM